MGKARPNQNGCGESERVSREREREMERRLNERSKLVKAANDTQDPLEQLPSFKKYDKKGVNVEFSTEKATDLDQETKDWLKDLTERNMKEYYEKSEWGWRPESKAEEMFGKKGSWYLLARDMDNQGQLVAFSHFRFEMDYDSEVLYVYELQVENSTWRKGLGKFMMQVLEVAGFKADMRKIMVTLFKHNPGAQKLFRDGLRYEKDDTSPKEEGKYDYEILSKFNKRKLAREEKEQIQAENVRRMLAAQAQAKAEAAGGCRKSCC